MAGLFCPVCGKELEEGAAACSGCGRELSGDDLKRVRQTKLTGKGKSTSKGILSIVEGLVVALSGIISTSLVGLLILAVGVAFIVMGIRQIRGIQKGPCPYCGEEVSVKADAETFRCPHCGKSGDRVDDSLQTTE